MDNNANIENGKQKALDNVELDQLGEAAPVQKMTVCGLRSSTRLLNKQKTKPEDVASGSVPDGQCKCNLSSCELCSRLASSHETLFVGKKRDFWTVQEQQDFFDGLKLYGKDFHSINIHMKSVAKRRARMMPSASSGLSSENTLQAATAKLKTKEQLRHFYYRKLQLCQRFVGNYSSSNSPSQPRDLREVYLLLCYDALKKIFRDKLDPRLSRPDFAYHLNQMITTGSTVVRVGRKGRFRAKAPACQALRSWNFAATSDGRGSGSGDQQEIGDGGNPVASGATDGKGVPLTNLPSVIVIELVPKNNFSWSFVQSVAHNPRIAISAVPTAKLDELRSTLEEKWRPRFGALGVIQDQVAVAEKITVTFHVPGEPSQLASDATFTTGENVVAQDVGNNVSGAKLSDITSEKLLQMSLIELFLLMEKDSSTAIAAKDNSIRLEYSIKQQHQQNADVQKPLLSPALSKLLHLASVRMKLLTQQQQVASAATAARLLSPSSSKMPLPRIDEEGQYVDSFNGADMRRPPNVITPRRRGGQRKTVNVFPQQQNIVPLGPQRFVPIVPAPVVPASNAVAVNFIEQLKELRGKSQRKNRAAVVVESNQANIAPEQHSPRILQQRRLIPKPVPVGIVESHIRFQAMYQQANAFVAPSSSSSMFSTNNQVVASSLDPNVNIVITPLQVQPQSSSSSQNFQQYMESNTQISQQQQPMSTSNYLPAFGDTSLDISLPGESTLVELLKPPFTTPSATNLNAVGEIRGDTRTANVLDLGSMSIVGGRPISPTATAGFDISFGDPSLGGFLGTDVASSTSLVNKNNTLTPWLMQETSMSFFESNGPGPFDESSLFQSSLNNPTQSSSQQPQNTQQ